MLISSKAPSKEARRKRAPNSGISLTEIDAARIKRMALRGDRQHDVASYHGVDSGRVSEVIRGRKYRDVQPMPLYDLPPPGPYILLARATSEQLRAALSSASAR